VEWCPQRDVFQRDAPERGVRRVGLVRRVDGHGVAVAGFYLEKYGRETFLTDAGQRSRAIIPGDDPGDQQPPERRGLAQHQGTNR
jgi:hypothetical protein